MSKAADKYLHRPSKEETSSKTQDSNQEDPNAPLGPIGEYSPPEMLAAPFMKMHKAIEALEVEASRGEQLVARRKGGGAPNNNVAQVRKFDDSATVEAHMDWLVHRLNSVKDRVAVAIGELQSQPSA